MPHTSPPWYRCLQHQFMRTTLQSLVSYTAKGGMYWIVQCIIPTTKIFIEWRGKSWGRGCMTQYILTQGSVWSMAILSKIHPKRCVLKYTSSISIGSVKINTAHSLGRSLGSQEISQASGMNFPILPSLFWSTDTLWKGYRNWNDYFKANLDWKLLKGSSLKNNWRNSGGTLRGYQEKKQKKQK